MTLSALFENLPTVPVKINEVAMRDGLQSEGLFVETADKVALINALSQAGLNKIEVTSFVSPKAVPMLADAQQVMTSILREPSVTYVALIPNEKGFERALEAKVDEVNVVMSVGELHNLANLRMTCSQSYEQFERISKMAESTPVKINGTIATAFGCPFEGLIGKQKVLDTVARYLDMGFDSITLADTVGMATPGEIYDVSQAITSRYPTVEFTLHLHNTRGLGITNALAGLAAGIHQFDSSVGGIGGCPYAPGATGNVCTEDLVHFLQHAGIPLHADLLQLCDIARRFETILGHSLPGQVYTAGSRLTTYPLPSSVQERIDRQN